MEPIVSYPHLPENARPISQVDEIGDRSKWSSVLVRMGDFQILAQAARIFEGKEVHPRVRAIIIPDSRDLSGSHEVRLFRNFINAGAVVSTPTCGPCLGGYMGILGGW